MVALPDFITDEVWDAFEEMRRKIKAPLTDFARKRVIHKLTEFHLQGYVAEEILGEAIERCWRSVFLTQDTPRRALNGKEQGNVRQINQMASSAFKVAK
jgi:hypothetical protein